MNTRQNPDPASVAKAIALMGQIQRDLDEYMKITGRPSLIDAILWDACSEENENYNDPVGALTAFLSTSTPSPRISAEAWNAFDSDVREALTGLNLPVAEAI